MEFVHTAWNLVGSIAVIALSSSPLAEMQPQITTEPPPCCIIQMAVDAHCDLSLDGP